MRVFVTGASGFVGSAIVKDLLDAGHQVLGLVRSDTAAAALAATGAEVYRADINDLEMLTKGAAGCDAVIHTAFNHDFSRYKESCEADRQVIEGLGEALAGTGKPLIITSGIGLFPSGELVAEYNALPAGSDKVPRAASEEAAAAVTAKGGKVYTVRLPPSVHGAGDHGFVPMLIDIAKEKGESAYIRDGNNRWPVVHVSDAAALYRLIAEQQPVQRVFHAVAEGGIPCKAIAELIGTGLNVPVRSKDGDDAITHFGWLTHFASLDCPASSQITRETLGWETEGPTFMADVRDAGYFQEQ